jgi:transcriptional regulator with XRE-family HTH domain
VVDPDKIRNHRLRRALSQRDLAKLAGMQPSTLNRIELGKQQPRPSTLRRLARALKVKPQDLFLVD